LIPFWSDSNQCFITSSWNNFPTLPSGSSTDSTTPVLSLRLQLLVPRAFHSCSAFFACLPLPSGYVVGLGDRHAQNILIDKATAEVVHIDLGVAFEQGKTLRTPEVVPFRLTRDIVDGMGITGCEGIFRRCCEETMRVLRSSHELLLTIMEVFIHDPLFKWALSPVKALQLQREDNDQGLKQVGENGTQPMPSLSSAT